MTVKRILKWLGLGLGIVVAALFVVDSDFMKILLPVRTLFPVLLVLSAALALILRSKVTYSAAALFLGLGLFIFIIGRTGYSEKVLSFDSAGTTLEGTLYMPDGAGPFPAVVVVHGSLCAPRRLYHSVAVHLAKSGIAVFSFDKRGTGNSGGECVTKNNAGLENLSLLAGDVVAALEVALLQSDVDPGRLGLWGISQGGWIAPLAAEKYLDLGFMVLVSGPTVSVGEENYYSQLTGDIHGEADNQFTQTEIEALVEARDPSGFDPYPVLQNLALPTLWVFGGKDQSIPVKKSIKRLEELQQLGKPYEFTLYPESSHVLIEMQFPFNFSDGFQDRVAAWIKEQPAKTP